MDENESLPESPYEQDPALPGAPIGKPKPVVAGAPITDPDIPELQDRRRPRP